MLENINGLLNVTHGMAALYLAIFALLLFAIEIFVSERYYAKNKEATRQPANHDYGALFIRLFPFVGIIAIIFGATLFLGLLIGAIVAFAGTYILYFRRNKSVKLEQSTPVL